MLLFCMILEEMMNLEKIGFGAYLYPDKFKEIKKQVFAKRHPDLLGDDSIELLKGSGVTFSDYLTIFFIDGDHTDYEMALLKKYHPKSFN